MNMMPDRLAADRQNQIKKLELLVLVDILLICFFLCVIYLNFTSNSIISRLQYLRFPYFWEIDDQNRPSIHLLVTAL